MDGEKRAVQIEIEAKDERRLKVLLSKAMGAVAYAEEDVNLMTESAITKYLDDQAKCYVTFTPNEPSSPAAGDGHGGAQPKGTNEK